MTNQDEGTRRGGAMVAIIERWHRGIAGDVADALDDLLADDVVFYSPVVYTPQRGKAITTAYLQAALVTLDVGGSFRYVHELIGADRAVLEFETELEGIYINGVDLITAGTADRIVEFKVMVRPMQAIEVLRQRMMEILQGGA